MSEETTELTEQETAELADETIPEQTEPQIELKPENLMLDPSKSHHENIYDMLVNEEEITWRSIIFELIKTEKMDPWDVNVSQLSKRYISTLKKLKEMNLQLSGKVLLCAALLLRIKSTKLVGDDMMEFDRLLSSGENTEELYGDDDFVNKELGLPQGPRDMTLLPRTPQPRTRKVSVYDLIDALAVALNVRRRRILNKIKVNELTGPEKTLDLTVLMDDLFLDVIGYLEHYGTQKIAFSELCPGGSAADKVYTFIPLLHMTNARKTDLEQKEHFGEIWISVAKTEKQETLASEHENPKADSA